ncbi:MAG: hypothetical protein IT378_24770 [Sandaracinaceae bacterium]|nr:hypothetical protein [Sandaracinaceae bacterium]
MGRTTTRKIEMTWRCSSCGERNLGRYTKCTRCGDPKDATERYEMPGNTRAAPSVTDAGLLRLATAGPTWQCGYCGSHQRALDGSCAQCGASKKEGATLNPTPPSDRELAAAVASWRPRWSRTKKIVVASSAGGAVVLALVLFFVLTPKEVDARVASVRWEHLVHVDRWRIWEREGFAESVPATAFDRRALGERHHHDEQVLDGYDTETYYEQVACGEDCHDEPEHCYESCSDDGNGFATCTEHCSGGGRSCSTRYCSEARTRQVPRYRSVPVYRTWYAYRVWDWGLDRTVRAGGAGNETHWPSDSEVALNVSCGEGERERTRRATRYEVSFRDEDGETYTYHPSRLEEFGALRPGLACRLRISFGGDVRIVRRGA